MNLSGPTRITQSNTPIALTDPSQVWIVKSGKLDVFSVESSDTEVPAKRQYFFTASEGDILFGLDPSTEGTDRSLIAYGHQGCTLVELTTSELMSVDLSHHGPELAEKIDRWIEALSDGVTQTIPTRPQTTKVLRDPGDDYTVDGDVVSAYRQVYWLKMQDTSALFIGLEDIQFGLEGAAFPLSPSTWIQANDTVPYTCLSTETYLSDSRFWHHLQLFYRQIMVCDFWNLSLLSVDQTNQLSEKLTNDSRQLHLALSKLSKLLMQQVSPHFDATHDDPLFSACRFVANSLGINLKYPLKDMHHKSLDPLADILRTSHVQYRQIYLKPNWMKANHGPILGFKRENRRAIALLRENGQYFAYDPVEKKRIAVTPDYASSLFVLGYCFYKCLPQVTLSMKAFIRRGLQPVSGALLGFVGLSAIPVVLGLFIPLGIFVLFDHIILTADLHLIWHLFLAFVVISLSSTFFSYASGTYLVHCLSRIEMPMQAALFERVLSLPLSFHNRFLAGDLARSSLSIADIRSEFPASRIVRMTQSAWAIIYIPLLFYFDAVLATAATALIMLYIAGYSITKLWTRSGNTRQVAIEGRLIGWVAQLLSGLPKLKSAGAEIRAFSRWAGLYSKKKDNEQHLFKSKSGINSAAVSFHLLGMTVIVGLILGLPHPISVGKFIGFYFAFDQLFRGLMTVLSELSAVSRVPATLNKSEQILQTIPEYKPLQSDPGHLTGKIELNSVTFRYQPDLPHVLTDISVHINPGEFVAFVGPSGSGKSTLMRLLLGFSHPQSGSIYYDGQDLSKLDARFVRGQMGVVLQNSTLMSGTIFSNIVGNAPLTVEDAWQAANFAGIGDDIAAMPMGMDTVVTDFGQTFSGGQLQRMLIARALAKQPQILLLDEATSALDNPTQKWIQDALSKLHATRIVVAHRLSTIQDADRIYVLDGGRVVETGTFDKLMADRSLFFELAKRQQL